MAAAPAAALAAPKPVQELPDLSAFPNPIDKVNVLLESAAEIEHMLLVQYLYAGLTLKSPAAPLTSPQQSAVRAWKRTLIDIAIEEMGHLLTVQNLRLFVRADPTFDREEFPPKADVYPFALHIEPLTQVSLAKYILAESPMSQAADLKKYRERVGAMTVHHVGIVYAMLAILFLDGTSLKALIASPKDDWEQLVAHVAVQCGVLSAPTDWFLADAAFEPGNVPRQGVLADFATTHAGFFIDTIGTREQAKSAIRKIALQGEGPATSLEVRSHYERFREIDEGGASMLPFPPAGDPFVPAVAVGVDPKLSDYTGAALDGAQSFDRAYAEMIAKLLAYLTTADTNARTQLANEAVGKMHDMKTLAAALVQVTQNAGTAVMASPLFTVPPVVTM